MIQDERFGRKCKHLTQMHAQIDSHDCFSFCEFKDKIRHSRGDFFLFFRQTLDFKHSLDAEMSLEEEEIKRFKDLVV